MVFLPRHGRLQQKLFTRSGCLLPMSETIQGIEVTPAPDGAILEDETYLQSEKTKKIELLRKRYGTIDENRITWVMVKRKTSAECRGAA